MKLKIILKKTGFRYCGELLEQDELFYTIFDQKAQKKVSIAKTSIEILEELNE